MMQLKMVGVEEAISVVLGGRNVLNVVLIANEVMETTKRKNKSYLIQKLTLKRNIT